MKKQNMCTKFSCGTPKEEIMQRGLSEGSKTILTHCHWAMCQDLIALPCVLDESCISTFLYTMFYTWFSQLPWFIHCSRLLTAWSSMFWSQITNTQTLPNPKFLEPYNCNKVTIDSDTLFPSYLSSVGLMALCRSVMGDDGILYEVYEDTYSDEHETEILDGDSDVPTTSSHKQL